MAVSIEVDEKLWTDFEQVARRKRRDPVRLLTKMMSDYLEMWEDERLFDEIRREVKGRELTDQEAVEFVKRHRAENRQGNPSGA